MALVPLYIDSKAIAGATGLSPKVVVRMLRAEKIAKKQGKAVVTTRHALRETWPDAYREIVRLLFSGAADAELDALG